MKSYAKIALTSAIIFGAAVLVSNMQSTIPARMLFPLYIAPGTNGVNWNPVISANTFQNIDVILNPSNGPGNAKQTNYVTGIARLKAANVGIYGYVYSTYGVRPIADVKADIDKWASWYGPLTGIFVDEAEYRAGQGDEPYYAEIYSYIKSRGMRVINNPGTGTTEAYLNLADTTCVVESSVTKSFTLPAWAWAYPSDKFCYLAWGATSVEQMRTAVDMAAHNNMEYIFITLDPTHPWSSIPPYLAEEAALLAGGAVAPTVTAPVVTSVTRTTTPTVTNTTPPTLTPVITLTVTPTITKTPTPQLICVPALSVVVCNRMP